MIQTLDIALNKTESIPIGTERPKIRDKNTVDYYNGVVLSNVPTDVPNESDNILRQRLDVFVIYEEVNWALV